MTNKQLQELLKQYPDDAQIISITVGNRSEWNYTPQPKVEYQENAFGKKVFIR